MGHGGMATGCNAARSHLRLQPLLALTSSLLQSLLPTSLQSVGMPYVLISAYACDECLNSEATITKYVEKYNRSVGLCEGCNKYLWKKATKESHKFSEFKHASYCQKAYDRDGTCIIYDDLVAVLARKCELREQAMGE